MVEYYSGPCANEIYAPYVYVGHCYGYGDEAVLHHRIGVASAPEWIGQLGFFLVLTCLWVKWQLLMFVEFQILQLEPTRYHINKQGRDICVKVIHIADTSSFSL